MNFIRVSGGIASCIRNFRTDFLEEWPTPGTGPHFDTSMQSNFTGLVGKTVHLVCKVKNLGNRTVSLFLFFFFIPKKLRISYIYANFELNNWKLYESRIKFLDLIPLRIDPCIVFNFNRKREKEKSEEIND